jgi:hypothetical protein
MRQTIQNDHGRDEHVGRFPALAAGALRSNKSRACQDFDSICDVHCRHTFRVSSEKLFWWQL